MAEAVPASAFRIDADGRPIVLAGSADRELSALSDGVRFAELARTQALNAIVYAVSAGRADPQPTHAQDEVYVVVHGSGRAVVGEIKIPVTAGTVLVVPADTRHHLEPGTAGLVTVAIFAPPLT